MRKNGKMVYVPRNVLDRLFEIQQKEKIEKRGEAWSKLIRFADIGMNTDDVYKAFFGVKRR
jgi:hypothetical protein